MVWTMTLIETILNFYEFINFFLQSFISYNSDANQAHHFLLPMFSIKTDIFRLFLWNALCR